MVFSSSPCLEQLTAHLTLNILHNSVCSIKQEKVHFAFYFIALFAVLDVTFSIKRTYFKKHCTSRDQTVELS